MREIVINLIFFILLMLIIFYVDYRFVLKKKLKGKKKSKDDIMEINYLIAKFKLDKKKILYRPVCMRVALINGFIISFVVTVIANIKLHLAWQLLIGFALLFALIYSLYEIYGRILVKKGWKKNNE